MNPRANKFLSVDCPWCGAEIGQPCCGFRADGEAHYVRRIQFFDGQEYLAKLQREEAKLEKTKP